MIVAAAHSGATDQHSIIESINWNESNGDFKATTAQRLGAESDFEYCRIGKILQRPNDCRICETDLERKAMPDQMMAGNSKSELQTIRRFVACCRRRIKESRSESGLGPRRVVIGNGS